MYKKILSLVFLLFLVPLSGAISINSITPTSTVVNTSNIYSAYIDVNLTVNVSVVTWYWGDTLSNVDGGLDLVAGYFNYSHTYNNVTTGGLPYTLTIEACDTGGTCINATQSIISVCPSTRPIKLGSICMQQIFLTDIQPASYDIDDQITLFFYSTDPTNVYPMYLFVPSGSGNYTRYMVNKVPGENSYFTIWNVRQASQYMQLEIIMPGDIVDGYGDIILNVNPPLTATDYLLYLAGIILGIIVALAILSFVWKMI